MLNVRGVIVPGLGAASNTVRLQMPFFEQLDPKFKNFHAGTINVFLEEDVIIKNPDIVTNPIQWHPNACEVFHFLNIRLNYLDLPTISPAISKTVGMSKIEHSVDAVIYIPTKSPNYGKRNYLEIMTSKIPVKYGDRISIEIAKSYTTKDSYVV